MSEPKFKLVLVEIGEPVDWLDSTAEFPPNCCNGIFGKLIAGRVTEEIVIGASRISPESVILQSLISSSPMNRLNYQSKSCQIYL